MIGDNIPTLPPGPNIIKVMEKVTTQITHAPVHPVGAGFFTPNGSVLSGLGTHSKSIFLSPLSLSKYPSWHWKLQLVNSSSLVFGSLTAWRRTCGVGSLSFPLSNLQKPVFSVILSVGEGRWGGGGEGVKLCVKLVWGKAVG